MINNTTSMVMMRLANAALPALSGNTVTYNPEKNVYLTLGYTSTAGNTYFKAVRCSDRLAVHFDIGEGYAYTFLNGITLFAWDGTRANIIGRRTWGGCDWVCFSEHFAMEQTVQMLKNYLEGQAKVIGQPVSDQQLQTFSRQMVEEVYSCRKQIA